MDEEILLFIITDKGNIAIPFRSLLEVDNYTIRFEDINELIQKISKIINRDLSSLRVVDSYLEYNYKTSNGGKDLKGRLPIKYREDNFDETDLSFKFANYLKEDYERILDFNIKYINFAPIHNYVHSYGSLTDRDIDMAINAYFKGGNYKKKRDIYFRLKRYGQDIKNNKHHEEKVSGNGNLDNFNINDEYLSSLADYARRGEEEYQNVMEIISLYDIDELSKKMKSPYFGVVDGMADYEQIFLSDITALEMATGISIQKIKSIIDHSIKERRKR